VDINGATVKNRLPPGNAYLAAGIQPSLETDIDTTIRS
jgi:hypothetical protein